MKKEKILKGNDLINQITTLTKSIADAEAAQNWYELTLAFNRANMPDFLGSFDTIKHRFINAIEKKIYLTEEEIEAL